ncbi:TetR/AcrR family transcriptional regulator [Breznakiella homolactica]|uniref:TetR/AcrR family transcriptional regulator n=1 Tax=Breznakiella homolactica TaxID=2798577 RepID=A0A7T7XJV5_9SPIR|nr:TetR/AcrR family transcriptional regulator [Breznakiella homolactica]QQO07755.1 TetR/AcrR family transcriptional regulator [Breznakiella homolactica]
MPKIVTEQEREQVRDSIYSQSIRLIREKGLRNVTVDDITAAAGIGKGSFYSYYPSREVCLYEVLKKNEAMLFSRMETVMARKLKKHDEVVHFLRDVYLAEDSLVMFVSPMDMEILLRKLPREYAVRERKKSEGYFERSLSLLGISKKKMETIALLTDCLNYAATSSACSRNGKKETLDVLVECIAGYAAGKERKP